MLLRVLLSMWILLALCARYGLAEDAADQRPVKLGIAHCCVPEDLLTYVMYEDLQKIAAQKPGVTVITRSANDDGPTQLRQIQNLIDEGANALLISAVVTENNREYQQSIMDILNKNNMPAVFYVKKMPKLLLFENDRAVYVSSMAVESAIEQGQMVIRHWQAHPEFDLNHDGVIQYAILRGTEGNFDAETRTRWVQATIDHYPGEGISAELVDIGLANWRPDLAEQIVDRWITEGKPVEVILANADGMAMGATSALEKHGMHLPVYGVHALPDAVKQIREGKMMGTISRSIKQQAEEVVNLAINFARGLPVTTNTREKIFEHEMMLPNIAVDRSNVDQIMN